MKESKFQDFQKIWSMKQEKEQTWIRKYQSKDNKKRAWRLSLYCINLVPTGYPTRAMLIAFPGAAPRFRSLITLNNTRITLFDKEIFLLGHRKYVENDFFRLTNCVGK